MDDIKNKQTAAAAAATFHDEISVDHGGEDADDNCTCNGGGRMRGGVGDRGAGIWSLGFMVWGKGFGVWGLRNGASVLKFYR